MFNKSVLALTVATLATLVAANPVANAQGSCNTGDIQCCQKLYPSQSSEASILGSLLGIDLGSVLGDIGSGCSPVTALLGIGGGTKCTAAPVCCSHNTFNGLINIGCTPINIGL
ncbi:hypothetical protein CC1G_05732 [Coprinopsis cinerea okayama7|uniref:Hydrophobin n=1 Tax=Coprinopsis cinerea (strain Okayama-7 / 130 / ATCC MYA-4618 / FGSC 9003) TaxID=240176 RepID=A8NA05_COPC7|nr:hypothetical protein CC1G_05732 [Coprinopsis cinerea okayama7\|eukprot:XP_001831661.1 hypothetical protein CC1G_05732 [Coprinopsis cinerea okayama7\